MFKIKFQFSGMTSNKRVYSTGFYKENKPKRLYLWINFGFSSKNLTVFY